MSWLVWDLGEVESCVSHPDQTLGDEETRDSSTDDSDLLGR